MNIWFAYSEIKQQDTYRPNFTDVLYVALANIVNNNNGYKIGLIANNKDRQLLSDNLCTFDKYICANFSESKGATIKLEAILKYLPEGDAIIDGDVFLARPINVDPSCACVLNYEYISLYKNYSDKEHKIIEQCMPSGRKTINAGFLYAPQPHFRKYAEQALKLSSKIDCIGHTYEQMFFLKYCQENNLGVSAIYDGNVHAYGDVDTMWQNTKIRHPFFYKPLNCETRKCIDIALQYGDSDKVKKLLEERWRYFRDALHDSNRKGTS